MNMLLWLSVDDLPIIFLVDLIKKPVITLFGWCRDYVVCSHECNKIHSVVSLHIVAYCPVSFMRKCGLLDYWIYVCMLQGVLYGYT